MSNQAALDSNAIDPNAIAIVGMAGRFPGADGVLQLWRNLVAGEEAVQVLSDAELRAAGVPEAVFNQSNYVKSCAFLEGADLFDAGFFGITPREAELIDPQQRVFLECAWEAIEDAGYDVSRYAGALGVFAGSGKNHYYANNLLKNARILESMGPVATTIASEKDFLATRVSYKLDLTGPSYAVQSACSTSLVAVHLACQSLLSGESDMALAGGVSISAYSRTGYTYVEGGIFAPDGHLRAFDAKAGGQVGGSGVAVVLLKRLEDALRDGDRIVCLIKGSAVNNDGVQKVSFNAPAVDGQAKVIAEALEVAGVEAESIGYVECHGTGTHLGDPIEVAALTQAYRASTEAQGFCGLGSLKTNVGHLDAAAGASGLIKAALALHQAQIPASLHFDEPNPELKLAGSPFYVNAELKAWPRGAEPRRAAVSSFGMGGTNAHVILEEATLLPELAPAEAAQLLVLSARSKSALDQACERLAVHLASPEGQAQRLADVAHTLQIGRKAFGVRRAVLARDHAQAIQLLREGRAPAHTLSAAAAEAGGKLAFLFSGQGSQYVHMTRGLYAEGGVFRQAFDQACDLAKGPLGRDLRELIFAEPGALEASVAELQKTEYTQPALFIVEYALAKQLFALGIEPAAMLGHSIGEYVAAHLAGVFGLQTALELVAARGRLIGGLPAGGEMLSVALDEAELAPLLGPELSISAINAPGMCVVSGLATDLARLRDQLLVKQVSCTSLRTSHAFHSALMDPILAQFEALVRSVRLSPPTRRVVSCTSGTWLSAEQATNPAYWVSHLREPVRFAAGVDTLLAECDGLLEVGPGEALTSLAKLCAQAKAQASALIVPSTRAARSSAADQEVLLTALGQIWCAGIEPDWSALRAGEERRRVPLCSYPFERQRYWIEPEDAPHQALAKHADMVQWFWAPAWRRLPQGNAALELVGQSWLIYLDQAGLGEQLAKRLRARGAHVHLALSADSYAECGGMRYQLDAGQREQHVELLRAAKPNHIVYLHSAEPTEPGDQATLERATELCFHQPMALGQALADCGQRSVRLDLVSFGMQDVLDDLVHPERASLLGVVKAISAELAHVKCRSIDLAPQAPGASTAPELVESLLQELGAGCCEESCSIALRAGQRWTPDVSPAPLPAVAKVNAIKPGALVLISGGLGGIALALAEGLARCSQARLLLLSRSALPARSDWERYLAAHAATDLTAQKIASMLRMEASGSRVMVSQVDVTDEHALRAKLAEVSAECGPVQAVIHAAGAPGGGLLALKTRAAAEQVLSAKLQGTQALERVLAGLKLDYFVLCSSLASQMQAPGQVDYFAANAYLDAEALAQPVSGDRRARPSLAIGWEAWSEVGMALKEAVPEALRAGREASLRLGLTSMEGFEVFRRAVASGARHVLVSTHDLRTRLRDQQELSAALGGVSSMAGETQPAKAPAARAYPRPELASAYVEPAGPNQLAVARLWMELLGLERVGADDDFFELGGNSLLLMQVSAGLRKQLDVQISMRELFELPSLSQVAERILALQVLERVSARHQPGDEHEETEEFRL